MVVLTYILSISLHLQSFINIHQLVHKKLSINEISTSIKSHKSVENEGKLLFNPSIRLSRQTTEVRGGQFRNPITVYIHSNGSEDIIPATFCVAGYNNK